MNKTNSSRSATWVQDQGSLTWVMNDPRSVAAMLRGHGDHRVSTYEKFMTKIRQRHPEVTQEQVDELYAISMRQQEERFSQVATRSLRNLFIYMNMHLKSAHVFHFAFFSLILKCLENQSKT